MSVETKSFEVANRRANLNAMSEKDFTIHEIEKVLQGAILGKGKAELAARKAIFTSSDLHEARGDILEGILHRSTSPDLTSVGALDLANLIGLQMNAVALSKKEKGVDDKDPLRLALRAEVIKDDGFCQKLYDFTKDEANQEKVKEALHILAADLDKRRLDAKVELHNDTLTEGHLNAMVLNRDLAGIKDQRDQAEIGEEIPRLNDEQRERVREHVATRRLLEKEQLEKIQKEIDSKSESDEEESDHFTPDEDQPEKFSIRKWLGRFFHRPESHIVDTETPTPEPVSTSENKSNKLFSDPDSFLTRRTLQGDELRELEMYDVSATKMLLHQQIKHALFISYESIESGGRKLDASLQAINERIDNKRETISAGDMIIRGIKNENENYAGYHYEIKVHKNGRDHAITAIVMFPGTTQRLSPDQKKTPATEYLMRLGIIAFGGSVERADVGQVVAEDVYL